MSETFIRHFVAAVGTLIALCIFYAGYVAGEHAWMWAIAVVILVYPIVYAIIHADGH